MIGMFRSTKAVKNTTFETLLAIKELYPLAYGQYKEYFERRNPKKCDLFLSLLTRDTFSKAYVNVFLKFFSEHNLDAAFLDFEMAFKKFNQLNERLLALKN